MRILIAASEATPYSKTGGLADVIGALPFALKARGEDVAVVLPLHRSTGPQVMHSDRVYDKMPIVLGSSTWEVGIRRVIERGVPIYFVDCPLLFDRPGIYGEGGKDYPDSAVRFAVFCEATLGVVRSLFRPDVIHCHDWQTALLAPLIHTKFRLDPTFYGLKTLLTIHNLGYQGLFPKATVAELGLPQELMTVSNMEFFGQFNLLKGGIVFSDALSTVSKAYAREIQTAEYGFGLDGLLRDRADVLTGILNGVDYTEWSPDRDPYIAAPYDIDDLKGKATCKRALLETFGLPHADLNSPVIGIVSRFVGQKGFDLIEEIADDLAAEDVLITAIGTGHPRYEELFVTLAEKYPGKIAARIAYDNALAHQIEAGADLFLMPSRYEPCGLNQIYSLRYGTIPIVRATGGLDDTINESNGFKFQEYSGPALLAEIRKALAAYRDKLRFNNKIRNAMSMDFSWDTLAVEYSDLYRKIAG